MDSDGRLDVRHTGGDASYGNEMSQMLSFDIAHGQSLCATVVARSGWGQGFEIEVVPAGQFSWKGRNWQSVHICLHSL